MNTINLRIGVEEAETAILCCRGLIVAYCAVIAQLEQAFVEQQMTEILTIL